MKDGVIITIIIPSFFNHMSHIRHTLVRTLMLSNVTDEV
jgi:hypothetical protein